MNQFNGDSGTILVVDDEQNNIQVVGTMLSTFGYDVMAAKDGEQALERIQARTPDLVLLDIYMPGKNGFEVCADFAEFEEMKEVPVIFLSADNEKNTVVKALESGGVDYVAKPFNKAELLARVRTHLELKRMRDECGSLLMKTEKFLEAMAHDLKNWVGSAAFSAKMLESMDDVPEKAAKISSTISESSEKALGFIEEFLLNARASKTELDLDVRMVNVVQASEHLVRLFEEQAKDKDISIKFCSDRPDIQGRADRGALDRILENLISNAIKFSPRGSSVGISVSNQPVSVSVTDEGPGFSEEDREKLFEPYTRLSAKPTNGEVSTGLGLSIVKKLCDRMGLELRVENSETGARITLEFPEKAV